VSLHPSGGAGHKTTSFLNPAGGDYANVHFFLTACHAQSLAATNRVTEQLSWLAVESFIMSCSISWTASLIDNLYLLDLMVLVIN